MAEQLDLFRHQPIPESAKCPDIVVEPEPVVATGRTQMTELPGETWEDAFGGARD